MDYLNRSNIPKTISKSPRRKKPRSAMLRQSDKDKDEILMNSIDLNEDSRLKRKKQMLDHELDQCIIAQETQHMIDEMEKKKTRLLDEQKELKNEREKIIRIESAKSKSYDPDQPQYMDDRLEMIDAELQLINSRIKEARKNIILTDGVNGDENGFSNAINIIKSTSFDNLQKLTEMLLSDIVEMKLKERHHMAQVASNERTIADLRVTLQVMKKTAVSAAIEYERKVKDLRNQQAYRQDQANKTSLSEFDDNYSDVTGGEMDDEDDGDISNILKKEKSIVENDADDNWLGKGEIYKKIYETGVIKGGRAEAVVSAAASNQNSSTEDVDLSNNEASLDYISTSYTPGLPFEIYQNINEYKNEESKEDNGEGEYLNDDDLNLPVTPVNKQLNDASLFVKPLSSGGKLDNSPFLSPNTENTIINTIINSGTLVNTSTPYKEFDINTPLKSKGKHSLSPIEFSQNNHDASPLEKTISLSKDYHNIKTSYTNTDTNTTNNTNNNTNTNTYTNTNTNNNTNDIINETNNNDSNNGKSSNDKNLPWSSASDSDIDKKSSQTVTPSKNSNLSTTPIKLGNNNTSSIPISSSKKTKKFEFKKPDEIIKTKKLISPPKNNNKIKSPSGSTATASNKTPKKDDNNNKTTVEEKSPAKMSSFMSTLKNSTHFLAAFHNPFTSPKKSPIKKPSFLFLQNLKIGGSDKIEEDEETNKKKKETTEKDNTKDKTTTTSSKNDKEEEHEKDSSSTKDSTNIFKTPKRKNDEDLEEKADDKFISPPPSKRIRISEEKDNKGNGDRDSGKKEGQTRNSPQNSDSNHKINFSSPGIKSPINTLSDIVKSVHEESMQKLQNEMMNRTMNHEKPSTSQDNDNSGDPSRLAYIHTQASQAKINTKSIDA